MTHMDSKMRKKSTCVLSHCKDYLSPLRPPPPVTYTFLQELKLYYSHIAQILFCSFLRAITCRKQAPNPTHTECISISLTGKKQHSFLAGQPAQKPHKPPGNADVCARERDSQEKGHTLAPGPDRAARKEASAFPCLDVPSPREPSPAVIPWGLPADMPGSGFPR